MKYLILGASSDVGMTYIEYLLNSGMEMTIIGQYRSMSDRLKALEDRAEQGSARLILFKADLLISEELDKLIAFVKEEMDCPDRIVHLPASELHYRKLKDADWDGVNRDFLVQVMSAGRVLGSFLPGMAKKKYGRVIIMLSSVVCDNPPKFMSEYAIVKNALWGLIKSAAVEYGDKNVCVSGLSPEMMETKLLAYVDEKIIALNAEKSGRGRNFTTDELLPYIDRIMSEETDKYNGVNLYPEK